MKKFFTLVCGMMMALSMNAAQSLDLNFNPWGDAKAADGVLTFSKAWDGAGIDFADPDLSDYDYVWVTLSESTCPFNMVVEYNEEGVADSKVETIAGTLILGVKLDESHSDNVKKFYLQNTSVGRLVVTGAYLGTEGEYEAAKAATKIEKSDLSLASLTNGWNNSSFDQATHTITIGEDWSGAGWWLNKVDYSAFDKLVINFDTPTATNGEVVVEYNNVEAASSVGFEAGSKSVEVKLDAEGKSSVKQIYVKGPEGAQFVLTNAYVCTDTYVPTGISSAVAAPQAQNTKIFNLAGQQVDESYQGVVIKNGKKFVQK